MCKDATVLNFGNSSTMIGNGYKYFLDDEWQWHIFEDEKLTGNLIKKSCFQLSFAFDPNRKIKRRINFLLKLNPRDKLV